MTADHLAARLLEFALSLRARFFLHPKPKVYEVSSTSLATWLRNNPEEFGSKGERAS